MAVIPLAGERASDTRHAFDAVASEYDASNRENALLERMRTRSLAALVRHVHRGAHVLDLGCGPGTDFGALVRAGYDVTAVDGSTAMADEARRRAADASTTGRVQVHAMDIEDVDRLPAQAYDAAYSSFGPLNCVSDLDRAASLIRERLRPGGVLVASVIGRVCPWELVCYAWRRDWPRLRVRFASGVVPVPLGSGCVWTRYYTPAEFERPFQAAGFRRVSLAALGILVPPPYMEAAALRHPAVISALLAIENRVAHWPGIRSVGDHFLIVLRRW